MKITLEKKSFIYEIKPYFNMAFLFVPVTLPLMNMWYTFILNVLFLYILTYFDLVLYGLIINIPAYIFAGHFRIIYLAKKGYRPIKNSSKAEIQKFNKITKDKYV